MFGKIGTLSFWYNPNRCFFHHIHHPSTAEGQACASRLDDLSDACYKAGLQTEFVTALKTFCNA
jgi:hypothetical protein